MRQALGLDLGLHVGGRRSFSLLDIADIAFWFDPTFNITPSAGSKVAAWSDRAAVTAAAVQGTSGNQPTIGTAPNGAAILAFTGTQHFTHAIRLVPPFTLAAVAKTTSAAADFAGIGDFSAGAGGPLLYARSAGASTWGVYANALADSGVALTSLKVIVAVVRDYNDMDLRTNGASVHVTSGVSAFVAASVIGCAQGGGVQCLEGQLGDLVGYSRPLTTTECSKAEAFLRAKYAL